MTAHAPPLLGNRLGRFGYGFPAFRQIRIQKTEHMGTPNDPRSFLFLQLANLFSKFFHLCPMHFRSEMMFGVITVVEEKPVVNVAVAAHTPGNRLVGIPAGSPVIAI